MGVIAFVDMCDCFAKFGQLFMYSKFIGVLMLVPNLLMLVGFACFLHYTIFDNIDTRKRLVPACALMVFANVIEIVLFIIAVITIETLSPRILTAVTPGICFGILIWIYNRFICMQWVNMGLLTSSVDNQAASQHNRDLQGRSATYAEQPPSVL